MYEATHEFDVCVIGGGMSGICAAIAAARNGARTALIHDRPVFGGNASSEVRMWICGAHGKNNKETGILEEIQLENLYLNPARSYSVWDSVLWSKIRFQPGLTPFLNCSCTEAAMDGEKIASVRAWQLTSQTWHTITAKQFIDCSGDSILAELTPAEYRIGREARAEFNEDIEPLEADKKTMGNSLLIQLRRTDEPQPFTAPRWAYKFTSPDDVKYRVSGVSAHNFWWVELGGINDTIRDSEEIRDELMRVSYGVWDYLKNRAPEREKATNWALEWMGSLPGKRESRRYIGDHILTQNDIRAEGKFADIVAYGGWSMDDHHPAGLLYPGRPTIFHPAPSPYGIPYRSLYSKNVPNLLFAGRNISVTHAALSSTRVMATCAVIGQAVGTAAALCVSESCNPRLLDIALLQETLMDDDCWLPGKLHLPGALTLSATLCGDPARRLLDGMERDRENESHAWEAPLGESVSYHWATPQELAGVRLVFDSDLSNTKRMAHVYPQSANRCAVPDSLVKAFRLEAEDESGTWSTVYSEDNNYQRLVLIPLSIQATALRLTCTETWGDALARVFAFEPLAEFVPKIPALPDGPSFVEVRARIPTKDLAAPDNGLEEVADTKGPHSA
nr:FAD-dependent oxidoreductase [Armatimonas sp.]